MERPAVFWGVRGASIVAAVAACFALPMLKDVLDAFTFRILILCALYVTLSVSLNLINGITGQFSIGHAAFYMVGAYSSGVATLALYKVVPLEPAAWLVVAMIIGALVAALAGFLVGLPSLRLRGDYLAIVTLGFGEIIRIAAINTEKAGPITVGGSYGMNIDPKIQAPWLVFLLAVITVAVCRNLLKNAHGLPFLAVREDEVASSAMGVVSTNVKVAAFVLGSAFAGAAGALLAHNEGFITPDMFKMEISFMVLTMVVLGGSGSITGSVLAAIVLTALPEWLRTLEGPDGNSLKVGLGVIVGVVLAVVAFVAACRFIKDKLHKDKLTVTGAYAGAVAGGIVLAWALGAAFNAIPALGGNSIDISSLRMSIFAVILIATMLIRPEGVLGTAEFGWSILARKKPDPSGAAA